MVKMLNNLYLSVIIPVYNVELYLNKCLKSVVEQTYKRLEIILVDDGSTDNSGNICDQYAKIDNRIIVIHKENAGVSAARNDGIEHATGGYICFIDSDDWIESDYFELAVEYINKYRPVCLINNYVKDDGEGNVENVFSKNNRIMVMNSHSALFEMLKGKSFGWHPVAAFYEAKLLKQVRFDKNIHFGEDLLFKYELIKASNGNIVYLPLAKYHYVFRESSASNSYSVAKRMDDFKVIKYIMKNESNEIGEYVQKNIYFNYLVGRCRLAVVNSVEAEKDIATKLKKEIRNIALNAMFDNSIPIKMKLKILVCLTPNSFIRGISKIYKFLKLKW